MDMGIGYRADRALGCTIAVWDGDISAADARNHLVRLARDPDWPPGSCHLTDLRTIRAIVMPDPELVELLLEGSNLVKNMRIAVIVPAEFPARSEERYETSMNQMQAATFTDLDAACEYLGRDSTDVASVLEQVRQELLSQRGVPRHDEELDSSPQ
jgi:hypothetical protein